MPERTAALLARGDVGRRACRLYGRRCRLSQGGPDGSREIGVGEDLAWSCASRSVYSLLTTAIAPLATHPIQCASNTTARCSPTRVRNAAFHEALARVIRKGETTVADIGTGTGFLGFLAAKLGAKRVDMYETAEVAERGAAAPAPQQALQLPHRPGALDRRGRARPRRRRRQRDARQLPLRGEPDRHAQRCARAVSRPRRRDHPARRRAVRLSRRERALPPRADGCGTTSATASTSRRRAP